LQARHLVEGKARELGDFLEIMLFTHEAPGDLPSRFVLSSSVVGSDHAGSLVQLVLVVFVGLSFFVA